MFNWKRNLCVGVSLLMGVLNGAQAIYVGGNPLMSIDPTGLATQAEINAAMQTLGDRYPRELAKMPASVGVRPMGKNILGMTDFANRIHLNSERFGTALECVKSGDEYQFLQTLAHESLHINESLGSRLLSNGLRIGNPLGHFHRAIDDRADAMVTPETIEVYQKNRNANKDCMCR